MVMRGVIKTLCTRWWGNQLFIPFRKNVFSRAFELAKRFVWQLRKYASRPYSCTKLLANEKKSKTVPLMDLTISPVFIVKCLEMATILCRCGVERG